MPIGPPIELSMLLMDEVIELVEFFMPGTAEFTVAKLLLKLAAFDLAVLIVLLIVCRTVYYSPTKQLLLLESRSTFTKDEVRPLGVRELESK
jgi:hypothetical protein